MLSQLSAGKAVVLQAEPLKPYTTFKIGGPARFFVAASSTEEFRSALDVARQHASAIFVLGGGSNILVNDRGFDGVVLHPVHRGIEVRDENAETVTLGVNAAEPWDDVVKHAVEKGLWGIENLAHIPGQSGAALVQNIGAYGQQVSDAVESTEVMEIATGESRTLHAGECGFAYRRSIFNSTARGRLTITGITLRLKRQGRPQLDYPDVHAYFQDYGTKQPSLAEIRQAIISIRDRKFPFPREERGGNAGSFFKNLSLLEDEYQALRAQIQLNFSGNDLARLDEIRNRFPSAGRIKIPTAFLIEICGLKGFCIGGAKVNDSQPLVLLNQGGATAQDVMALAQHVRKTIRARTGMAIAIEPELVGFSKQEIAEISDCE
jgi:UDP-N-acetylmuramate dehydrogenase